MTEPRVLLLTSSFPQSASDPTADFIRRYAEAVDLPGTVITPEGAGEAEPWTVGRMPVQYVPYWMPRSKQRVVHGWGIVENLRRHPWARLQIPPMLASWAWTASRQARGHDVVVSHWALPTGPVGAFVANASGVPLVSVLHSGGVHALNSIPGGGLIARSIYRSSTAIVSSSSFVRDRFVGLLAPTDRDRARAVTQVLPMGFVPSTQEAEQRNHGSPGRSSRAQVLFLGRINPIKGLDILIDACAGIEDVDLQVAGYGPALDACRRLAKDSGVKACFHGQVDEQQKWDLLDQADVLVVPSRVLADGTTEGLPVVLLEALGRGTPVIATSVGGIPDLIRDGVEGLLVSPDDTEGLRGAIQRVLSDPDGSAKRANAGGIRAAQYDWSVLGPYHRAVLVEAAEGRPPIHPE